MKIKYIECKSHPGGLVKITAVVEGDIKAIANDILQTKSGDYELRIEKVKKKRSLDANSYYWVLVDKLSRLLGMANDELHYCLMDRYGTIEMRDENHPLVFSILSEIDPKEVTPYSREIGRGEVNGKQFTHYVVLKGSHEMSTWEFSRLLDGCISECKECGIETLTPEELKKLKNYEVQE